MVVNRIVSDENIMIEKSSDGVSFTLYFSNNAILDFSEKDGPIKFVATTETGAFL
jgi:hypothetical protein